jgi:hypothetical protein
MTTTKTIFVNTAVDAELRRLVDSIVTSSPHVESTSAFARHGLRLALRDAIEHNIVTDPELVADITAYLDQVRIGDPISNGR